MFGVGVLQSQFKCRTSPSFMSEHSFGLGPYDLRNCVMHVLSVWPLNVDQLASLDSQYLPAGLAEASFGSHGRLLQS